MMLLFKSPAKAMYIRARIKMKRVLKLKINQEMRKMQK